MDSIGRHAKVIWDYMLVHDVLNPADIIICLGSHDLNTARRAAELYLVGMAPKILISGGRGKLTEHNTQTEAAAFAAIMYAAGVPEDDVMIEEQSTNTGENVIFSQEYLKENDINFNIISAIVVTKPYMERRAKATFAQFWPELKTIMTSQQISYEGYMSQTSLGKEDSLHVMVGDLQRIMMYPAKGWMAPQVVPENVKTAFNALVSLGYDNHIIKD